MSLCNCDRSETRELKKSLDAIDLWEPFERLLAAGGTSQGQLRTTRKAERARALGIAKTIATSMDRRATREKAALVRQLKGVREQLRTLAKSKEWLERVKPITQQQTSREAAALRKEHRESLIDGLLESELSAATASSALKTYDVVSKIAQQNGVPGVLSWLDGELDRELKGLSPRTKKASTTRSAESVAACVGFATAFYVVALAVCGWVPFCWCCYSGALHLAYLGILRGCV